MALTSAELMRMRHPMHLGRVVGRVVGTKRAEMGMSMRMRMMKRGEQLSSLKRLDAGVEANLTTLDLIDAIHQTVPVVDRHGPSWAKLELQPRSTRRFTERNRQDPQSRMFVSH